MQAKASAALSILGGSFFVDGFSSARVIVPPEELRAINTGISRNTSFRENNWKLLTK